MEQEVLLTCRQGAMYVWHVPYHPNGTIMAYAMACAMTYYHGSLWDLDHSTMSGCCGVLPLACMLPVTEPSRGRGAPDVPEPLTLGAQYLTRYNAWKKFVRATRPALVCASPKTNLRVQFLS